MSPQVEGALVGLVGVLLGGLLLYRLNTRLEEHKSRVAARNSAYVDFLTAIIEARAAQDGRDLAKLHERVVRLVGVTARIGLHGSPAVIAAIVTMKRLGADTSESATNAAFLDVYDKMRSDGVGAEASLPQLSALLCERWNP